MTFLAIFLGALIGVCTGLYLEGRIAFLAAWLAAGVVTYIAAVFLQGVLR